MFGGRDVDRLVERQPLALELQSIQDVPAEQRESISRFPDHVISTILDNPGSIFVYLEAYSRLMSNF